MALPQGLIWGMFSSFDFSYCELAGTSPGGAFGGASAVPAPPESPRYPSFPRKPGSIKAKTLSGPLRHRWQRPRHNDGARHFHDGRPRRLRQVPVTPLRLSRVVHRTASLRTPEADDEVCNRGDERERDSEAHAPPEGTRDPVGEHAARCERRQERRPRAPCDRCRPCPTSTLRHLDHRTRWSHIRLGFLGTFP